MATDNNNRMENDNAGHLSNGDTITEKIDARKAVDKARSTAQHSEILEQGDIFFFYRPKVAATEKVKGIEDIRRFFMVTASSSSLNTRKEKDIQKKENIKRQDETAVTLASSLSSPPRYRLFVIGKKSLPEVRTTEARKSERYWAKVGGIFEKAEDLSRDLFAEEYRKGDEARPVGEGKYAIVKHHDYAELAYLLEIPNEPGEAQKELGIEKEASYMISVINPKIPVPEGYPSVEQPPKYPESVLNDFDENENFVSLARNIDFINYLNAEVILIGARVGKDVLKKEMKIDINDEDEETIHSADIFNRLRIERENIPIRPLIEGKFE